MSYYPLDNEELRKLQEDFVYTNPYMDSEENNWNPLVDDAVTAVRNNAELKMVIAEAKWAENNRGDAVPAKYWDISSIEDEATRAIAERAAIKIGSRWLLEKDSFNSIDDMLAIVKEETSGITI